MLSSSAGPSMHSVSVAFKVLSRRRVVYGSFRDNDDAHLCAPGREGRCIIVKWFIHRRAISGQRRCGASGEISIYFPFENVLLLDEE